MIRKRRCAFNKIFTDPLAQKLNYIGTIGTPICTATYVHTVVRYKTMLVVNTTATPPKYIRILCDTAGTSYDLIEHIDNDIQSRTTPTNFNTATWSNCGRTSKKSIEQAGQQKRNHGTQ